MYCVLVLLEITLPPVKRDLLAQVNQDVYLLMLCCSCIISMRFAGESGDKGIRG